MEENKIKTCRWLFYLGLLQLLTFLAIPVFIFPFKIIIDLELLASLTVGIIFALFFLAINIYGLFVDKSRKPLYIIMAVLMACWIVWAIVSWSHIEYMDYLLR
jgi:hypothetical protein